MSTTELNITIRTDHTEPYYVSKLALRATIAALHDHFKGLTIEQIADAIERSVEDAISYEIGERSMEPDQIRERIQRCVYDMSDEEVVKFWERFKEPAP